MRCQNLPMVSPKFKSSKYYGLIFYRKRVDNNIEFLLYEKKNTQSFIKLLTEYHLLNGDTIQILLNSITIDEQKALIDEDFEVLWRNLIGDDRRPAIKKKLRYRVKVNLNSIRENEPLFYGKTSTDLPWYIPRGFKNRNEHCLKCAIRSFEYIMGTRLDKALSILEIRPIKDDQASYYVANSSLTLSNGSKNSISPRAKEMNWISLKEKEKYNLLPEIVNILERIEDVVIKREGKFQYKKIPIFS